ncbi:hypothetical protein NHQ30_001983 [Ciborinia camelliae]|nr:hypothetical protein NHQ30_001983 [Ciborinia camelliae]
MDKFTDEDQIRAIEYLKNAPTNVHGKTVAILEGFLGVGKTPFLAYVVVTALLGEPQDPIACICAANQPTDVLVNAINEAIQDICTRFPERQHTLQDFVVIRVYPTATEIKYLINLAEKLPKLDPLQEVDEDEYEDAKVAALAAYLPLPDSDVEDVETSTVNKPVEVQHGDDDDDSSCTQKELYKKKKSKKKRLKITAAVYRKFGEEGNRMSYEESQDFRKHMLPKAIESSRANAKVILTTPPQTAIAKFQKSFRRLHALFIDESGLLTVPGLSYCSLRSMLIGLGSSVSLDNSSLIFSSIDMFLRVSLVQIKILIIKND